MEKILNGKSYRIVPATVAMDTRRGFLMMRLEDIVDPLEKMLWFTYVNIVASIEGEYPTFEEFKSLPKAAGAELFAACAETNPDYFPEFSSQNGNEDEIEKKD